MQMNTASAQGSRENRNPAPTTQKPHKDSDQQLVESLLSSGIAIPPQPAILIEMERMLGQKNVNTGEIAKLVAQDAGISALVFKIISSPAYGLRKQVDSLEKAISVIGLKQIANIIKSAALRQAMNGREECYERFWDRSAEIGQLASIIAWKQRMVCNIFPDQAYMAGLFHDCGVPILMQRFPDYCKTFKRSAEKCWPVLSAEDRLFNTDHCVAGYLVARHWHLPDFICQAVRFHHEMLSTEHKATTMVAILQLAMHIHNTYAGSSDPEWEGIMLQALEELGITQEGLKEFEEEVYDTYKNP